VLALAIVYVALWWVAPASAVVFSVVGGLLGAARLAGAWTVPLPAVPSGDDGRAVLYTFYRLWPPVGLAVGLVAADVGFAWVLAGHLVLFAPLAIDEATRFGAFVRFHVWPGVIGWLRDPLWVWLRRTPDWFRYRLWPRVRHTVPSWFRHHLWPWIRHSVPNWFRHRVWVWFSHTVPSWFRYRWPEHRREAGERLRHLTGSVRHPRRTAARLRRRRHDGGARRSEPPQG
jgi:hypothetical protein